MVNKHKYHLVVVLPEALRREILDMFEPKFNRVYCRVITLAYGVPQDYSFSRAEREIVIYGRFVTDRIDSLCLQIDGDLWQPQREEENFRRIYHLTLSAAHGVKPAEGGNLDRSYFQPLDRERGLKFKLRAEMKPLWQQTAEKKHKKKHKA